jgi:hypothetical protein
VNLISLIEHSRQIGGMIRFNKHLECGSLTPLSPTLL